MFYALYELNDFFSSYKNNVECAIIKKINSIGYGCEILKLIMLFVLIFPFLGFAIFSAAHIKIYLLIADVSVKIGLVLLFGFCILLVIELKQDSKINRYYLEHKNTKSLLKNGNYECQTCGNCKVRAKDTFCSLCGTQFEGKGEKASGKASH